MSTASPISPRNDGGVTLKFPDFPPETVKSKLLKICLNWSAVNAAPTYLLNYSCDIVIGRLPTVFILTLKSDRFFIVPLAL